MKRTSLLTCSLLALMVLASPVQADPESNPEPQDPPEEEPQASGEDNATADPSYDCPIVRINQYDLVPHLGRLMRAVKIDPDHCYIVIIISEFSETLLEVRP